MDGLFYIYICRKSCNVCLKRPKINEKEARIGPFLKKNHSSFSQSANQIRFICFKYRKDLSQFQCIIFMPNFRGGGLRMLNIALTHSQCDIICQNFATVVKFTSLCAIFWWFIQYTYLENFELTLPIFMLLEKFSLLQIANYWKIT